MAKNIKKWPNFVEFCQKTAFFDFASVADPVIDFWPPMKSKLTMRCAILFSLAFVPITGAERLHVSDLKLTAFDGVTNDEFGISVSVDGDVAVVGAESDDGARGAAYIFERGIGGTNAWGLVAKLTAPDAAMDDWFGFSVAVAGDVALVGAYGNDDAGPGSGSAYVFERNIGGTNAWGYVCKLTASDAAACDYFGVAVAVDGDVAIVSASGDDGFRGSAYVFQRNAGGTNAWGQVAKIIAPDGSSSDFFGVSVSVAGDVAIVGAEQDDNLGSAYVFERNMGGTNAWGFVRKLTASDGAVDDHFGYSVSADGDAALVGAYGGEAAYVFQRNSGGTNAWSEVAKLTASDGSAAFGWSVAMDGGTAIIGAYKDDDSGSESGAAYVFERNANGPNAWGQVRKLKGSDGSAGDWFGCAVSASGNTALIGAFHDDPSGTFSGSAYVMPVSIETRSYRETGKLFAYDAAVSNMFGACVSMDGDLALAGSHGNDSSSGAAYVFERSHDGTNAWTPVARLAAPDAAPAALFGLSVSVDGDRALVGAPGDGVDRGAAYLFERDQAGTNAWRPLAKLQVADELPSAIRLGWSVSLDDDVALVGAPEGGSAYIFERNAGGADAWGQTVKLAANGSFGCSVSIDKDVALIGAFSDDEKGFLAGAAYVFERNAGGTNAWGKVRRLVASDGATNDCFGLPVAICGDTACVRSRSLGGAVYILNGMQGG